MDRNYSTRHGGPGLHSGGYAINYPPDLRQRLLDRAAHLGAA